VGKGRLLATSFDLRIGVEDRPVARQLLRSLLAYAASERFNPRQVLTIAEVEKLLTSGR
jgi:hypothetical protein